MKKLCVLLCAVSMLAAVAQAAAPAAAKTEIEYLAIMAEGKKIGHAAHKRIAFGNIVTTTETANMTIARAGVVIEAQTSETSIETADGKPIGFEVTQNVSGMTTRISGRLNKEGKFDVTTTMMGNVQKKIVDLPAGAVMAEGLLLAQKKKGMVEGDSFDISIFSPAILGAITAHIKVGQTEDIDLFGRVLPLTKVEITMQIMGSNMKVISYVDKELKALKTIMPMMGMNLELIACDEKFALSDNDIVDFLDKFLIESPVKLTSLRNKESLTYTLKPKPGADLNIPSGDNQFVEKTAPDRLTVTVRPLKAPAGVKFPYTGKDKKIIEATKPAMYLQSDSDKIRSLAKQAVGTTTDTAEAIAKIESFVHNYISRKGLSVGYASAIEVAESRQGDCTEHAVLTAAMCRSLGIPARIVVGIVYVDDFAGRKDVFGGHAWTEAFVGEKWIGLDAIRAPNGFDPTHIALARGNGDPTDFFSIINTLGCFSIEKVEGAD